MVMLPRRNRAPLALLLALGLLFLFMRSGGGGEDYTVALSGAAPGSPRFTKILAHAPGFSVIENLYWRNGTFFLITDAPWEVPEERYIALQGMRRENLDLPPPVQVLSVRGPGLSSHIDPKKLRGETISEELAATFDMRAEDLPAPMFLCNDDSFVGHYYHLVGEMFLGGWKIWQNFAYRTGRRLPEWTTISFMKMFSVEESLPRNLDRTYTWDDPAGANLYFMSCFFPKATIETASAWEERAASGRLYRMPLVVLADRAAGHKGPSAQWKPFGDVLRLPTVSSWWWQLRERIPAPPKSERPPKLGWINGKTKPHVLYLSRQDIKRRLADDQHTALVSALTGLEDEGLIDFTIRVFSNQTSFAGQVAMLTVTDILVAVHGNGLTHSLWMPPGDHRAVFEMQTKECTITDYSPLAMVAGAQHFLIKENGFCTPADCPPRGCNKPPGFKGGQAEMINSDEMKVDPRLITDNIRRIVAQRAAALAIAGG